MLAAQHIIDNSLTQAINERFVHSYGSHCERLVAQQKSRIYFPVLANAIETENFSPKCPCKSWQMGTSGTRLESRFKKHEN